MPAFKTNIVEDQDDVRRRLSDFGLVPEQIIAVADVATKWATDASPLMPLNAPGTLAYIHGVAELRNQTVGGDWMIDRAFGIEGVLNHRLETRIVYQNVDRACDAALKPHPRTLKGSGAEAISGPTLFEYAGVEPGPLTVVKTDGLATYYVMVAEDGTVELSCPIIENGLFRSFVERIFIRRVNKDWDEVIDGSGSAVDDFDVPVSFKK